MRRHRLDRFPHHNPGFWIEEFSQQGKTNFDLQKYVAETERFIARVTIKWGWNRRNYSSDYRTEFYRYYIQLRFRAAQAVVRRHILGELNDLLTRLGINARIVVLGLQTEEEIERMRERLIEGEATFNQVNDFIYN